MLNKGIYLAPSQYEALFLSTALSQENIAEVLAATEATLSSLV
jgi:glutamate-1-semialdehyde 2,1-aminomutase